MYAKTQELNAVLSIDTHLDDTDGDELLKEFEEDLQGLAGQNVAGKNDQKVMGATGQKVVGTPGQKVACGASGVTAHSDGQFFFFLLSYLWVLFSFRLF